MRCCFCAHFSIAGLEKTPYGDIAGIERAATLREALRAADEYVQTELPDAVALVIRNSNWRHQPASEKQTRILQEKGINVPVEITKGQASHLIGMMS